MVSALAAGSLAARSAGWYADTDLFCLWQGARLVASGADPYDEAVWRASIIDQQGVLGSTAGASCAARYAYPLWTAVLMVPVGSAPLPVAATAWMTASLAATAGGGALMWSAVGGGRTHALTFAAMVVTSQPFWILVISGQLTGILMGLLGLGAWLLSRRREGPAAAVLAALLLKPQIAGVFVPVVVVGRAARGHRTALLGALATGLGLLAISVAARAGWIPEWLGEVFGRRLAVLALLPTAWGLAADLFGTALWGPVLIVGLAVATAAIVRRRALGPLTFAALALAVSLFAMPHVWSYDFLVLALPWAVGLALARDLAAPRRLAVLTLTVAAASLLPWSLYAIAFTRGQETLSAVVPVASALVVAVAVALQPQPGTLV